MPASTLFDLLVGDLVAYLGQSADPVRPHALLWLDPGGEFARLVPHLAPNLEQHGARPLNFGQDAPPSQLALKLELLRGDDRGSAVVYLPGYGVDALEPRADGGLPALWALYEYRYTGVVWGRGARWEPGNVPKPPRLYEWLRQHGVELPADGGRSTRLLSDGGADSLLSRYAELNRDTDPATWPRPLRVDDLRDALAGDPRSRLRELFAAPGHAIRSWSDPTLVLDRIGDELGLSVPERLTQALNSGNNGQIGNAGNELADVFAVQLALTEAWDAFGRPDDFPYRDRLPLRPEQRSRQVTFLRDDVMTHTHLAPLFLQRMKRLELTYPLAAWAVRHTGVPAALPLLAHQRWQAAIRAFDEAAGDGRHAAQSWLVEQRDAIVAGAAGPWDAQGHSHWDVLAELLALCSQAEAARAEIGACTGAAELVRQYTQRWWRLDAAHLDIRARCQAAPGLERVRVVADQALFAYVSAAGDAFSAEVEPQATWSLPGLVSVESLRSALWQLPGGHGQGRPRRRSVIISDALRWDLAEHVRERLEQQGRAVELEPVLATLPTITPFGMSALLPLDQLATDEAHITVSYAGKPVIKDGAGHVLSTRDGRKALLETVLRDPHGSTSSHEAPSGPLVAFANMEDVLAGAVIPTAPFVVVFDNDIDQQGHQGGDRFPRLALDLAADVARTVTRLHESGIEEIHIVTDHGFLLLPPEDVDGLGRPQVSVNQAYRRESRWVALKPDAPAPDVFHIACPLNPDGPLLGFPRGVRTLEAAEPYEHGGISLHECVLPHLTSRAEAAPERLSLDVRVSRSDLTTGTIPVVLTPHPAPATLWSEPLPVTVVLWVEVVDGPAAGQRVGGPIAVEVRPDAGELRPRLYLDEGIPASLTTGQALRLRAVERDTGHDLATIPLTLRIDWE